MVRVEYPSLGVGENHPVKDFAAMYPGTNVSFCGSENQFPFPSCGRGREGDNEQPCVRLCDSDFLGQCKALAVWLRVKWYKDWVQKNLTV